MIERLVIGSANFGLPYGIANGRMLAEKEVFAILEKAAGLGVRWVDTARAYGGAEQVIGKFFRSHGRLFRVVTKLPDKAYGSSQQVRDEIDGSLEALGVEAIDLLLLHSFGTYERHGETVLSVLEDYRAQGLVRGYGASVYHPHEAETLLADGGRSAAVEFPLNLFDRRFLKNDMLGRLRERGTDTFVRSVFLQGLFFFDPERVPSQLVAARQPLRDLHDAAARHCLPIPALALLFVLSTSVDHVLVGVDSVEQLLGNAGYLENGLLARIGGLREELDALEVTDEETILPYTWKV